MSENLTHDDVYNMSDEDFQKVISQMNTQTSGSRTLDNSVSDNNEGSTEPQQTSEPEPNTTTSSNEGDSQTTPTEPAQQDDLNPIDTGTKGDSDDNQTGEQKVYTIKADGKEINLTLDELMLLAPKALNYTNKLQKIAPYRRALSALEENKITEDELNQLIEIRNGNSIAIKNLLDKMKIPTSEIVNVEDDASKDYKPQIYGKDDSELEWQEMVTQLQTNPNYETMRVYANSLDAESQNLIRQNPQALENFLRDIEAGVFEESCALAQKNKLMETGQKQPDIMYYIQAVQSLWDKKRAELEKQTKPKSPQEIKKSEGNSKAAARLSGDKSSAPKQQKVVQMISDIDEEDYQEFLRQVRQQY